MRKLTAAALSTLFLISCETTKRTAETIRPDLTNPERFDCRAVTPSERPTLPGEDPVDLDRIAAQRSVPEAAAVARQEVAAYVSSVRAREGVVSRYIVQTEGTLFECANDDEWARDFYSRLPAPSQ